MKLFNNIKNTINNTKASFKRFPLAMIFAILSAIYFCVNIHGGKVENYTGRTIKTALLFLIASVIFTAVALFLEGLKFTNKDQEDFQKYKLIKLGTYLLTLPLLYGIKENILPEDIKLFGYNNEYKYFGLLLFFIVVCFYISKIFYHKNYIAYVVKIIESIFVSILYSVVLYLGIVAIYELLVHLLDINLTDKILMDSAVIIFIPFNIGIMLSNFPKMETSLDNYEIGKAFKILLEFILMPIITVYLIILYVYIFKILFLRQFPKNILVNLILWFSIFVVGYLFINRIIRNSALSRDFRRICPLMMLPVLVVMFFAISIRVKEYGITENRYIVIAFGIWAVLSMIYYIFYKSNSNITIPIMLSIIILLATVGPLSAFNVSLNSQNRRLEKVLKANDMINGTKIIPKSDISMADKNKISEIVKYLTNSYKNYQIRFIPNDFTFNNEDMKEVFGFEIPLNEESYSENQNIYYNIDENTSIDISGYDNFTNINSTSNKTVGKYIINAEEDGVSIKYLNDKNKKKDLAFINIADLKNKLKILKKANTTINPEDLAIKGKSNGINYKIIFSSVYVSDNDSYFEVAFYLLTNE